MYCVRFAGKLSKLYISHVCPLKVSPDFFAGHLSDHNRTEAMDGEGYFQKNFVTDVIGTLHIAQIRLMNRLSHSLHTRCPQLYT